MATDTINGISGYISRVRGTATTYVRASVITTPDLVDFEAAKTAGASVNGTQTVDCGGLAVAGEDTGLTTATYTASINIDGTVSLISVDVTTADTFTTVIGLINGDLPGTELGITDGNLVVTSGTTGNASSVVITDVDLFSGMTTYVQINDPVDGGTGEALEAQTLDNGANAWTAYSPSLETYDTAADATVIVDDAKVDYDTGDLDAEAEIIAAINATNVKVNSLQDLVQKLLN